MHFISILECVLVTGIVSFLRFSSFLFPVVYLPFAHEPLFHSLTKYFTCITKKTGQGLQLLYFGSVMSNILVTTKQGVNIKAVLEWTAKVKYGYIMKL